MTDKELWEAWHVCEKATEPPPGLERLYWLVHCSGKELMETIGMTRMQFAYHYCIQWQKANAWYTGANKVNSGMKIAIAREFNLLKSEETRM